MRTRKPGHPIRPRVEAMESRALMSALAPSSTSHHHGAGVAEAAREHRLRESSSAYVEFINNAVFQGGGVNVEVRAQFYENNVPTGNPETLLLDNGTRKLGKIFFPSPPAPRSDWSIKVSVMKVGLPPQPPAPVTGLILPNVYNGELFGITVIPQGGGQLSVVAGPTLRRGQQEFQRASVRITNNTSYQGSGIPITVTAQVFENGQPHGASKTETIGYNKTGTFDFGHGPSGLSWEIRINVVRAQGSPPPYPSQGLSLTKNPNGGYHGKDFTITFNGYNFSVSV